MDQTLKQIASRTVHPWLAARDAEIRAARAAGQRAATTDMALLHRRHADFQDGLLGRATASVLAMQSELASYGRELRRQIDDLTRERDDNIADRMTDLREQRQRALHHLDSTKGPMSARFIRAGLANEEAEKAHRNIRAQVYARPLVRSFVGTYIAIMICLATFQVPVNRLAFALFFPLRPILALSLAFVVGAVLIFFAHTTGKLVRRLTHDARPAAHVKRALAALLVVLLSALIIYLLAATRQLYVESGPSADLSDLLRRLTQGSPANAIATLAATPLDAVGWTLLALDTVLVLVGIAAAYLRHDPHPGYEKAWRVQERTRRRLTAMRDRYEQAFGAKQLEFDERLNALDQLLRETDAKLNELLDREQAIAPFQQEMATRVANTVRNRSLAFLEGAVGAIKGPLTGSLDAVQAMPEADVRRRIGDLVEPAR